MIGDGIAIVEGLPDTAMRVPIDFFCATCLGAMELA